MTTSRDIVIHAGQAFALSLPYAGTAGRGITQRRKSRRHDLRQRRIRRRGTRIFRWHKLASGDRPCSRVIRAQRIKRHGKHYRH